MRRIACLFLFSWWMLYGATSDHVLVIGASSIRNIGTEVIDAVQVRYDTDQGPVTMGIPGPMGLSPGEERNLPTPRAHVIRTASVDAVVLRGGAVAGDERATLVRRLRASAEARRILTGASAESIRRWQQEPIALAGEATDWLQVFLRRYARRVNLPEPQAAGDAEVLAPAPLIILSWSCLPAAVVGGEYVVCMMEISRRMGKDEWVYIVSSLPDVALPDYPKVRNTAKVGITTYPVTVDTPVTITAVGPSNMLTANVLVAKDSPYKLTWLSTSGVNVVAPCDGLRSGPPPPPGQLCSTTVTGPAFAAMTLGSTGTCTQGSPWPTIQVNPYVYSDCREIMTGNLTLGILGQTRGIYASVSLTREGFFSETSDAFWDCNTGLYTEPDFRVACTLPDGSPGWGGTSPS